MRVEGVQTHRDAAEARARELGGAPLEQRAVRRQGKVTVRDRREELDEVRQIRAKQRLAPGQPELADAEPGEHAGDTGDLVDGQ